MNKRMFNVAKFKSWLEVNKNTPFSIKLLVLDNCVLPSILYGFEAWGDLSFTRTKLETIELVTFNPAYPVRSYMGGVYYIFRKLFMGYTIF